MAVHFINGAGFIENVVAFRQLWLGGRLGSGKTLTCVALAKWLYEENLVDGVFANFPIDSDYIPIRKCVRRSAVILDEGWSFADARNSQKKFEGYGAFARKLDSFWLSPSVFRVDKRMAQLQARRILDLWVLDAWLFQWHDIEGYKGHFLLRNYQECYGRYDHKFIPFDDGGIRDSLFSEIEDAAGSTREVLIASKNNSGVLHYGA